MLLLHRRQHKRFVPCRTHPNFYLAKTSFILETLSENGGIKIKGEM